MRENLPKRCEAKELLVAVDAAESLMSVSPAPGAADIRMVTENVLFSVVTSHVTPTPTSRKAKAWTSRPKYWTDIVEHHAEYGYESVCKEYANELSKFEGMTKKATLNRWKREENDSRILKAPNVRLPKYGKVVEEGLITDITKRIDLGLLLDYYDINGVIRHCHFEVSVKLGLKFITYKRTVHRLDENECCVYAKGLCKGS